MIRTGSFKVLMDIVKHVFKRGKRRQIQLFLTSATLTLPRRWSEDTVNIIDTKDDWSNEPKKDRNSLHNIMRKMKFDKESSLVIDLTTQTQLPKKLLHSQIHENQMIN